MTGPGLELIGQEEIDEVLDVLRSHRLARYGDESDPSFGASAILTVLAGLGIGAGDEVIVPDFTYVASISAIVYAGALPVLAEVDTSLNLDPADVEARITSRTKAILAVHMLGNPARLRELKAVADRHGLLLVEDCAQAFGASYRGQA